MRVDDLRRTRPAGDQLGDVLAEVERAARELAAAAETAREHVVDGPHDAAEELLRRVIEHGGQLSHLRDRLLSE